MTGRLARHWPWLAHVGVVALFFSGPLFQGQVPFFRDVLAQYYPDFAFLSRSVSQGVWWPLWNPFVHGGSPFLVFYPFDFLSIVTLGPLAALRLDAPAHVLLAMCGASALARARGLEPVGSWATGLVYGLSGYVLSCTNLIQLLHAAAWAPWVIVAGLRVARRPDARGCALLAAATALQVSTVAVDVVLMTALVLLVLLPERPSLRLAGVYAAAALLAAALAAPVLVGTPWRILGTRRELGFDADEAFAFSANAMVLLEALLPHLFGDVRSFSERGFWGKPFYDNQYPYFMSLYLGPGVVLLACLAGLRRRAAALWAVSLLGVLLSLGANGPLAPLEQRLLEFLRFPVKFFFLANLGVCLLAGQGVDRVARADGPVTRWRFLPAALLLGAGAAVALWPELPARLFAGALPELGSPAARAVARAGWPADFLRAGALCLAAAFALRLDGRRRGLAALAVGLDLLAANLVLHPTARADFYDLAPPLRAIVERARAEGPFRWFALSLNASTQIRFWDRLAESDVVAYRVARQSMLGSSNALDGLESVLETEMAASPRDLYLPHVLRTAEQLREYFPDVRLGNVRWIVSLRELPPDLVRPVGEVPLLGLVEPLRVYEVPGAVPRAFWTPRCAVLPRPRILEETRLPGFAPASGVLLEPDAGQTCDREPAPAEQPAAVAYEHVDPHTVRLRVRSPAGFVAVIEGFHPDWHAETAAGGRVPLLRAYGRYWALPTPGGEQTFVVRFRPRWPAAVLTVSALGWTLAAAAVSYRRR